MAEFRFLDDNKFFDTSLTITATTEATDFPVENLNRHSRSFVWRSTSDTAQRVVLDLGTATDIDSFAMFFNPLNDIQLTTSATVKLEANATDVWGAPAVSQTITINQTYRAGCHFFSSAQNYRYWSVYVDDPTNPDGYVQLDALCLAEARQLTQAPEIGLKDKRDDQSKRRDNEYGHEYWDLYPQRREVSFAYKALSEADRQSLKSMYATVGTHTPIAVSFDNGETIFGDKEEFLIYGRFTNKWEASQVVLSYFDTGFNIREAM